jgi:flagellar basal body-associated protein FliL
MNKKIIIGIIIAILIIVLGIGGYFYWSKKVKMNMAKKSLETLGEAAEKLTESITKGVLPSFQTNPLENKPDINPADKANPFKNLKINPF